MTIPTRSTPPAPAAARRRAHAGSAAGLLAVALAATGSVEAAPRDFTIGSAVKTPVAKTDFHLKLASDANMSFAGGSAVVGTVPGGPFTLTGAPALGGNGTRAISLDWTVAIPAGQTFAYSVKLMQQEFNTYRVTEEYFTPKASPTDVPVLGLRIEPNGDFFLGNDSPFTVRYDGLAIGLGASGLSDSEILALLLDGLDPAGSLSGSLASGTEQFVGNFPLQAGEFLSAQMLTSFTSGDSILTSELILQHEHQIPVPGGLALAGAGLLAHAFARRTHGRPGSGA